MQQEEKLRRNAKELKYKLEKYSFNFKAFKWKLKRLSSVWLIP